MVLDCCVNFCAVGIPLMISSFVMVASLILQIVGCVTPLWFNFTYKNSAAVSPSADGYQGFFGHCYRDTEYMCCGTIDDYYDKIGGKPGIHRHGIITPSYSSKIMILNIK